MYRGNQIKMEEQNMNISKMKAEAIRRLEALGVNETLINELKENFKIKVTHHLIGKADDMTELHQDILDQFNALDYVHGFPYYILEGRINGKFFISVLYVEENEEEWEFEFDCIKNKYPHAYVYNFGVPELSEIGTIVVDTVDGVLRQIG